MKHSSTFNCSSLVFVGFSLAFGYDAPVQAATFVDLGHAAGAQCATSWVNDNGQAVGNCTPASSTANNAPWYATSLAGPQQVLPSLVTGQPCAVSVITNSGAIVGGCANANNVPFGVIWNAASPAAAPIQLTPLPGTLLFPLLRPADVQTSVNAQNQQGAVLGQSLSATDDATVVLYAAGSGTPQRVSSWGDNCVGADVNNTLISGYPSIAMNCPGAGGINVATVARGSAGGYNLATLPLPSGASYCAVVSLNDQLQLVGTCVYPNSAANVTKTAFWASPTSTPNMLTLPVSAKNRGVAINNLGHVLARGMGPAGIAQDLFWDNPASSFGIRPILPLPGSVSTIAVGFADNDTIALNCQDANQYPTACFWTDTGGTQAIAPTGGGLKSALSGISQAGTYVFGVANDSAQNSSSVAATLP